jgi:hypothetical protein
MPQDARSPSRAGIDTPETHLPYLDAWAQVDGRAHGIAVEPPGVLQDGRLGTGA